MRALASSRRAARGEPVTDSERRSTASFPISLSATFFTDSMTSKSIELIPRPRPNQESDLIYSYIHRYCLTRAQNELFELAHIQHSVTDRKSTRLNSSH